MSLLRSRQQAIQQLGEANRRRLYMRCRGKAGRMVAWEYLIVALPAFEPPVPAPGASASVAALNREGNQGWEAVGMTALADGTVAVLLKKPKED